MLNLSQEIPSGVRRLSRRGPERRIFSVDPAKKRDPLFGIGADQIHPLRRGGKRNGWWIDNLDKIETGCVRRERCDEKTNDREIATARCVPVKEQRHGGRSVHFGAAPARETDEIPCSSAALVTATTNA